MIARFGDVMFFYGFQDCAAWFVGVGAIVEAAVL